MADRTEFFAATQAVGSIAMATLRLDVSLASRPMTSIEAMQGTGDHGHTLLLSSQRRDDRVLIEVRDRGAGTHDLARMFEPFFTTKESGMGIGLSICRSIVEAHGGRVWATANADEGMTFSLTLPVTSNASRQGAADRSE